MAKNTSMWKFDKETQLLTNSNKSYESQFQFKLSREKNDTTYEEKLVIECLDNGNPNGIVVTDLLNLEKDIKKFMKYGVAFSGIVFADIVQAVKNEYVNINVEYACINSKMVTDEVIMGVIELVREYCNEDIEKNKEIIFTTSEFEELLVDTEYEEYDIKEIRKALADREYLVTKGNRTSKLKKINGKPVRVISFISEKLKG